MNVLDIIVMVVLIYNAAVGSKKGLIRILFDLVALIGGVIVAIKYYPYLDLLLTEGLGLKTPVSTFISFLSVWGTVFAAFYYLGKFLHRKSDISVMKPLNVLGGTFFGGVRGFLYLLPILIPLSHTDFAVYHESKMAKPLQSMIPQKMLSAREAKQWLSKLHIEPSERRKKKALNDPKLKKIRNALETGQSEKIRPLLEKLE